jgi:hypothetical protein
MKLKNIFKPEFSDKYGDGDKGRIIYGAVCERVFRVWVMLVCVSLSVINFLLIYYLVFGTGHFLLITAAALSGFIASYIFDIVLVVYHYKKGTFGNGRWEKMLIEKHLFKVFDRLTDGVQKIQNELDKTNDEG